MDSISEDTLLAIEQNSNEVTYLQIGALSISGRGVFNSRDSDDYERLGTAVGNNTQLTKLAIGNISNNVGLTTTNKRFYDGIRHNSSITELFLSAITYGGHNITDVALEVMRTCQKKNILTKLYMHSMPLMSSAVENRFIEGLRGFTNLREISYKHSDLTDDQLLLIVEAIRGYTLIEDLNLNYNRIGNAGCEALATLRN